MPFGPTLTTGDVTLRPPTADDLEARRALGINAEIVRLFGGAEMTDREMSLEAAEAWYSCLGAEGSVEWVVEHAGQFLGSTRLHSFNDTRTRARYAVGLLDTTKLGNGIGSTVTRAVLRYGFNDLGLQAIELVVLDFNERAQRCYRSCGFREIERIPSGLVEAGRPVDDILMLATPETAQIGSPA